MLAIDKNLFPAEVVDGAITTPKLAALAVSGAKIADNAVSTIKITDGAITAAKIADGVIPGVDSYSGGLYVAVYPNSAAVVSTSGITTVTTGTLSTPTLNTANQKEATRRSSIASAATAGSVSGLRCSHLFCWRGNAPGLGGFRGKLSFALTNLVSGNRGFVGLQDTIAAPTNIDPLTSTGGNKVGIGFNTDTGNLQLIHNLSGVAPTTIDLGSAFAINTTDVWTIEIRCLENASSIDWAVTKAGSNAIAAGNLINNIPPNNVFLAPHMWMSNNAQALAVSPQFVKWIVTSKNGGG